RVQDRKRASPCFILRATLMLHVGPDPVFSARVSESVAVLRYGAFGSDRAQYVNHEILLTSCRPSELSEGPPYARIVSCLLHLLHLSYLNSLKLGVNALDSWSPNSLGKLVDSNNNRSAFVNRSLELVCAFLYLTMDKSGLYRLSRPAQILNSLQEISSVSLKGSRQRFEIVASG